jgi:serine/threonine protein kinase
MLDKNFNIRLIDFGMSKSFQSETSMLYSICGSANYKAPEVIQGKSYSTKSDIWSLGIIFYEMLTGNVPFQALNHSSLFQNIIKSEPAYAGILPQFTTLLENILKKDPNERFSLQQIKDHSIFQDHPYLKFLKETLGNVMASHYKDFVENDFGENLLGKKQSIILHILSKEKITELIKCLNCYDFMIYRIKSDEKIEVKQKFPKSKSQFINKKNDEINTLKRTNYIGQHIISPRENHVPHINHHRQTSFPKIIIKSKRVPICGLTSPSLNSFQ